MNLHVNKNAGLLVAKPFSPLNVVTNSTITVIALPQTTFRGQALLRLWQQLNPVLVSVLSQHSRLHNTVTLFP